MSITRKTFRLGVLGGGLNSAVGYTHFCASKMDNRWQYFAGCCSKDHEQNFHSCQKYGISEQHIYSDWHELLKNEKNNLDAILVLTPTPFHKEMVSEAIQNGYPVVCEKSITTTFEDALYLKEIRQKSNGFLALIYNYSGYPMIRELRNQIHSGQLGKIIHFQVEMPQEGFIRTDINGNIPKPQSWRLHDGIIPTIYLDLGSHLHQMISYLTDSHPRSVIAEQGSYGHFSEIVDNVYCMCHYTNDIQGSIWFSKSALGYRNGLRIRIFGTKGSAEWYQMEPEQLNLSYSDGRREILDRGGIVSIASNPNYTRFKAGHPAGFVEAMANLYCDIADGLEDYKAGRSISNHEFFGVDLACEGMALLNAMAQSVHKKNWCDIERM